VAGPELGPGRHAAALALAVRAVAESLVDLLALLRGSAPVGSVAAAVAVLVAAVTVTAGVAGVVDVNVAAAAVVVVFVAVSVAVVFAATAAVDALLAAVCRRRRAGL